MSTISGLLLRQPEFAPFDMGRTLTQAENITGGRLSNQTRLIELEALRRQQDAQAVARQAIQQDPSLLLGGGGPQSTLGSPALTMPQGGGPMTQQAFGPGGMGQPQPVPGGQDLSRFATDAPPGGPQSTLAGLQGQGQPAPQNRLEALLRQNPEAGLQVMQQQFKIQEQRLGWGEKIAASIGRIAQGVNDQASLDQARDDIRQIDPKAAAQLPQFYSKEAMEPFIQRALSVHQAQTLKMQDLTAQADVFKAQLQAQAESRKAQTEERKLGEVEYKETPQGFVAVPKYPGASGPAGVGGTPVTVGGQTVQGMQGQQQAQTQTQQTRQGELALMQHYDTIAKPYREVRDAMGRIDAAGTSPTAAGDAALLTAYMKMLDPTTGVRNEEIKNAENVGGLPQRAAGWLEWLKGGAPLQESVRKDFLERAKKLYAQYMKDYEDVGGQYRTLAQRQGYNPANVVLDYRSTTPAGGRGGQGATTGGAGGTSQGQGMSGQGGGKVLSDADIAATMQASGKTRQQVLDAAKAKGYTVR